MAYPVFLGFCLVEPLRESTNHDAGGKEQSGREEWSSPPVRAGALTEKVARILTNRAAALLLVTFVGANFVAAAFLTWLPTYIFERFDLGLSSPDLTSKFWPLASLPGLLPRGLVADSPWVSEHRRAARPCPGAIEVSCYGNAIQMLL